MKVVCINNTGFTRHLCVGQVYTVKGIANTEGGTYLGVPARNHTVYILDGVNNPTRWDPRSEWQDGFNVLRFKECVEEYSPDQAGDTDDDV